MTEIIRIEKVDNLMADEKLPTIPSLVKKYLSAEKKVAVGKFWQIKINQQSNPSKSDGIAYSCELVIEKKTGVKWQQVYSTGMRQYRGAYNYEIDNWDLCLNDPHILCEAKDKLIFGLRTRIGNIYIYQFKKDKPDKLEVFNTNDFEKQKTKMDLQSSLANDPDSTLAFIKNELENHWYTASKVDSGDDDCCLFHSNGKKLSWDDRYNPKGEKKKGYNEKEETGIVVFLARRWDRDYDPICINYQIYFWIKGYGLGESKIFRTGLHHPGGKFYRVGISFEPEISNIGSNSIVMSVRVWNKSQQWEQNHSFRVEWGNKPASALESLAQEAMERCANSHSHDHPLYQATRIKESLIDSKKKISAWILFEQIDLDRNSVEGEGWLGDQFRYSLWKLNGDNKPDRIYEDHAYIRRSFSNLTKTRGRSCELKDLKLKGKKITVNHNCGETVEENRWETLTFNI